MPKHINIQLVYHDSKIIKYQNKISKFSNDKNALDISKKIALPLLHGMILGGP